MAKQLVNPFERHVEKAVLGLAGLALIASIATYVVRTPNRTELGGETVTPGSVDERIAQKAGDALKRMQNAKAEPTIPEPLAARFEGSLKPIKVPALPLAAALRPEVPRVDDVMGGPAGLVKVSKPAKPVFSKGRGTFVVQEANTRLIPSDWVTVSAVWNVKEQKEAQIRDYGSAHSDIVLAPPQLQRRMQHPDGTWSEGDWQDVDCSPAAKLPREPVIRLVADGKKITVDRDTLKEIDRFRADLLQSGMQLDFIRPMPPDMAKPTHWSLPIITSLRDVLMQDDELVYPNEVPSSDPNDRYGLGGGGGQKAAKKVLTPAEEQAKKLEDARVLLDSAVKNLVKNDATKAYNWALEVSVAPATTPADKEKAKRLQKDAEQAGSDIERKLKVGTPTQPVPGAGPATAPADKPKREKLPTQQVWAHDAKIGNLVSGATYQYRMRFRMLNVLAGAPNKFEKAENAAVVLVASDWSDPTDPVTIEPSVEYYVTGEDPKDKEISVDYFRWYLGVWVKPERRMKCGIGQTLSDRQRIKVPGIDDPNVVETAEVEFAADAVVIDVDLDRPIRERKAGSTPKGVRFGASAPGTAAVLVDSQGRLTERFVLVDKNHPGKKEVNGRLWTPKK